MLLREQGGGAPLHLRDLRAEVEGGRAQDLEHGLDLALVVERARLRDLAAPGSTISR